MSDQHQCWWTSFCFHEYIQARPTNQTPKNCAYFQQHCRCRSRWVSLIWYLLLSWLHIHSDYHFLWIYKFQEAKIFPFFYFLKYRQSRLEKNRVNQFGSLRSFLNKNIHWCNFFWSCRWLSKSCSQFTKILKPSRSEDLFFLKYFEMDFIFWASEFHDLYDPSSHIISKLKHNDRHRLMVILDLFCISNNLNSLK